LDGFGRSFSFSALFFFDDLNQFPSSVETSFRDLEALRRPVGLMTLSEGLVMREVRLAAIVGRNDFFVSSSLSDGRRIIFLAGDPLRMVFGMAEGNNFGRALL
jgi:hypothetical protein